MAEPQLRPDSLHIITPTEEIAALHGKIRDRTVAHDAFVGSVERLMRLLIERALEIAPGPPPPDPTTEMPSSPSSASTPRVCGVSIMRGGDTLARSLKAVMGRGCRLGKLLIATNETSGEPELHYLRLPKRIGGYTLVFLMDATVATGAAAMMAVRILLEHDVLEENISMLSLLMAESGVSQLVSRGFPTSTTNPKLDSLTSPYRIERTGIGSKWEFSSINNSFLYLRHTLFRV